MKLLSKTLDLRKIYYHKCFHRSYCDKKSDLWPRRILSGIQPTGTLHIGNYFGVVRRCVQLQEQGDDVMIFIADLHSLTSGKSVKEKPLQERVLDTTAALLGSGIDPLRSVVFVQSHVQRHTELCWLLTCLATQARLQRLPQYRERATGCLDGEVPLGILLYPVLQAADVLVYRGTHVPVGLDQLQHLQLASHLARVFNRRFTKVFPTPQPLLPDDGSDRILSLRDPMKKMSKSDTDPKSRILMSDSFETIEKKIKKAVTDFTPKITFDPEARPGISNLVRLHCLSAGLQPNEAVELAATLDTVQYKSLVAHEVAQHLGVVQCRMEELRRQPNLLHDVLRHGAEKARRRADRVYADVARAIGLV